MVERIPPLLRRTVVDQLGKKVLAQVFNHGGVVFSRKDGTTGVIPGAKLEVEIQPPGSGDWTKVKLPRWDSSGESLTPGEVVIIIANLGQGHQGRKDKSTWRRQDVTPENAAIRAGYSIVSGHRGGMRQANSPTVLKALFRRPSRKYR